MFNGSDSIASNSAPDTTRSSSFSAFASLEPRDLPATTSVVVEDTLLFSFQPLAAIFAAACSLVRVGREPVMTMLKPFRVCGWRPDRRTAY